MDALTERDCALASRRFPSSELAALPPMLAHSFTPPHTHASSSGDTYSASAAPPLPLAMAAHAHAHAAAAAAARAPHVPAPVQIPAGGNVGVLSPPTPAPSPSPSGRWHERYADGDTYSPSSLLDQFRGLPAKDRFAFLVGMVDELRPNEALVVSRKIEPRLRRDFLRELPAELALHCLSFVDDAKTLARAAAVSRYWFDLLQDEQTWQTMVERRALAPASNVGIPRSPMRLLKRAGPVDYPPHVWPEHMRVPDGSAFLGFGQGGGGKRDPPTSFKEMFKTAYQTEANWRSGGRLLLTHTSTEDGVVTTVAMDDEHIVIGMANSRIHIFDAMTGQYRRSLLGHESGVWALVLVSGTRSATHARATDRRTRGPGSSSATATATASPAGAAYHAHRVQTHARAHAAPTSRHTYRDDGHARRASFNAPAPDLVPPAGTGPMPPGFDGYAGASTQPPAHAHAGPSYSSVNGFPPPFAGPPPSAYSYVSSAPSMGAGTGLGVTTPGIFDHASGRGPRPASARAASRPREQAKHSEQAVETSDVCGTARGWGQERTVVVSGGCDRAVKVWDVETGLCLFSLRGHTSTIRCLKVLNDRPIAVSGSRDCTLRVWDVERGEMVRVLEGHEGSVRCVEVSGNRAVSGSYDFTCRLWDVDTGECLQVLRGHYHQIYAVAFDGVRIVSGSLDSTVRVWSAETGDCTAILQGHTSLVGQLQLAYPRLVTAGSDGRVIIFDLSAAGGAAVSASAMAPSASAPSSIGGPAPMHGAMAGAAAQAPLGPLAPGTTVHRLCAHDNSVTSLQFDDRFVLSGGNDGRVKLWDIHSGAFIRELVRPCDAVWRIVSRGDLCAVLCQRAGRIVLDLLDFRPDDQDRRAGAGS
ncbi:hypothetical protein Q5752_005145 [Cryptotrichosporon argae]